MERYLSANDESESWCKLNYRAGEPGFIGQAGGRYYF